VSQSPLKAVSALAPAPEAVPSLAEAAKAGDRAAFGRLFARYAQMIHGIALARLGPGQAEDADDIVQDTFITALERIGSLRESGAVGPWLAQIARNLSTDAGRRRTRRRAEPLEPDVPAAGADAEARAEAERGLAIVKTLPAAYHETLVLRLVEGLSGPEIAKMVGLTEESVRVNLHRGMKLLKEALGWDP
jgi:RNA polymerase sigma-70 factor (ECF subfamily)